MNVDTRGMRTRLAAASMLLAVLWSMAGCGGSGSSGFDVSPLTEAQAIGRAIDRGECLSVEEQTYCASGVEASTADFHGASVIIEEPSAPLVCDGSTSRDACTASLEFTTVGFVIPNSLLAAVSETESGPWTLVPLTVSDDLTGPRTVSITVPGSPDEARPRRLIAAVLVYVGVAPEHVPPARERLADFGVDLVYVSSRLKVVVPQ